MSLVSSVTDEIKNKLNTVLDYKENIRTSINEKGTEVSETDPLRVYSQKIDEIEPTNLQEKEINLNKNGTTIVEPDEEYNGLSRVTVNSDIGVDLNIYCQLEEPISKDGIWLQTNKDFSKVVFDLDIIRRRTMGLYYKSNACIFYSI